MSNVEAIKKALEEVGPLKVEFTPDCDDFNSIIAPINADYDGTYFTVIGCGEKQDKLGTFMASAVNAVPEILTTLEALQRENETLRKALKPFSDHAGGLFQINFNRNDEVSAVETKDCFIFSIKAGAFFDARTALASAGEEHHAE